jgi:hypothetical protein
MKPRAHGITCEAIAATSDDDIATDAALQQFVAAMHSSWNFTGGQDTRAERSDRQRCRESRTVPRGGAACSQGCNQCPTARYGAALFPANLPREARCPPSKQKRRPRPAMSVAAQAGMAISDDQRFGSLANAMHGAHHPRPATADPQAAHSTTECHSSSDASFNRHFGVDPPIAALKRCEVVKAFGPTLIEV